MEKMPVATQDTACIKRNNTHQLLEKQLVYGIGMSFLIKNGTKTPVIMRKFPKNHRKN
jgi:hypothetical protein